MDNENSKKKTGGKRGLYLVVALLAVALVAGVVLLVLNREKGEPEDPTIEKIVTQSGEIIEVYNPCVDDELKEKPLSCFTDTNYSLDFLGRFRSSPERCWVAVDGYAYDVTPGEDGYEYPGPGGTLDHLCGQDASERFATDSVAPPEREYLEGSVRQ